MNTHSIVITTTNNLEEAKQIAEKLLHAKLAACVQIDKVNSLYQWKGNIENSIEFRLMIKSNINLFSQIQNLIQKIHSYETPQILQLDITNSLPEYSKWINQEICNGD